MPDASLEAPRADPGIETVGLIKKPFKMTPKPKRAAAGLSSSLTELPRFLEPDTAFSITSELLTWYIGKLSAFCLQGEVATE